MNKITKILALSFAMFYLVGITISLTSLMDFIDVLPVYILMGTAIVMMGYEAFFDRP